MIIGVATAEPAFIGYTERAADDDGNPLAGKPWRIASAGEFAARFGGAPPAPGPLLPASLVLYFANGGGACWIVSVGSFDDFDADLGPDGLRPDRLAQGLAAIGAQTGPTLLLAPDANRMAPGDQLGFQRAMLTQAADLGDRMAILDLPGAGNPATWRADAAPALAKALWEGLAGLDERTLGYGAIYHPWLAASGTALPPSPAVAGLICVADAQEGPWRAPANMAVAGIDDVTVALSDTDQAWLNAPANGMAICAIRRFPTKGVLVWGARTMAGNSGDWRYIPVRRTAIYIEQSIKTALARFAFEPNTDATWSAVVAMTNAFLTDLWREGGLVGARPADAFSVACGLGSTMAENDVLDGYLNLTVLVALTHPAEFMVLSFRQAVAQQA